MINNIQWCGAAKMAPHQNNTKRITSFAALSQTAKRKRLPPYGKRLKEFLLNGHKPKNDIFLFVGNGAWHKAEFFKNSHNVLILPPNNNPDEFDWSIVRGFSVLIFATSNIHYNIIRKLAYQLLSYSSSIVRVILANHKLVIFYHNENTQ